MICLDDLLSHITHCLIETHFKRFGKIVFENMENEAFAPQEQMFIFHEFSRTIQNKRLFLSSMIFQKLFKIKILVFQRIINFDLNIDVII